MNRPTDRLHPSTGTMARSCRYDQEQGDPSRSGCGPHSRRDEGLDPDCLSALNRSSLPPILVNGMVLPTWIVGQEDQANAVGADHLDTPQGQLRPITPAGESPRRPRCHRRRSRRRVFQSGDEEDAGARQVGEPAVDEPAVRSESCRAGSAADGSCWVPSVMTNAVGRPSCEGEVEPRRLSSACTSPRERAPAHINHGPSDNNGFLNRNFFRPVCCRHWSTR
jgi:hypothetical protein